MYLAPRSRRIRKNQLFVLKIGDSGWADKNVKSTSSQGLANKEGLEALGAEVAIKKLKEQGTSEKKPQRGRMHKELRPRGEKENVLYSPEGWKNTLQKQSRWGGIFTP